MTTIDFSKSRRGFDMTDPNFLKFGTAETKTASDWSWLTTSGHDLELHGSGLTYDANGRALSGTVKSIKIDLGNDAFDQSDISITGLNISAKSLDDGTAGFWDTLLSGHDTIIGPDANNITNASYSRLVGDSVAARHGTTGGNDTFELRGGSVLAMGDAWTVGSPVEGGSTVKYKGGDDVFDGTPSDQYQGLIGDAFHVYATGDLTGGNDRITLNGGAPTEAVGDAYFVTGIKGDIASLIGGNDVIQGAGGSYLFGDVRQQEDHTYVRGGNDTLTAGSEGSEIVGDVGYVGNGTMIGGHDVIRGGTYGEYLYGDFVSASASAKITAGNDVIHGGAGEDNIYGDGRDFDLAAGGNDILYGDAGEDRIFGGAGNDKLYGGQGLDLLRGNAGNDFLDGGSGADSMYGGVGNDTYVIDNVYDDALELDAQGIDTVRTTLQTYTLGDHLEHLSFTGKGNFNAFGNTLNNAITGGAGQDTLIGLAGNDRLSGSGGADSLYGDADNDVLNGGAGGDLIDGGGGIDTASYAGSETAVRIALNGTIAAMGDAAGDVLNAIENLEGTRFGDMLIGNGAGNRLTGGDGADTMKGEAGNDILNGGTGRDVLYGGADADVFVFDVAPGSANADTIRDFAAIDDTIHLDNADFIGLGLDGALKASAFKLSTQAKDADDRIIYNKSTGELFFDKDGSGASAAVHFATLSTKPTISHADFFVI